MAISSTKTGFEAVAEGIGVAAGSMALISKHKIRAASQGCRP